MTGLTRQARRVRAQGGFTLVEVMMGAMIAAVGIAAVTTVLIGSRELVTNSERDGVLAHIAEREMERALAIPYSQLALRATPPSSTNSNDPRFHVGTGGVTGWTYRWDQTVRGTSTSPGRVNPAPGLTDSVDGALANCTETGVTAATPGCYRSTWTDGRLSGTVYRLVTAYDDPGVTDTDPVDTDLPAAHDGRRVTIVVTVDGGTQRRAPVVMNSVVFP